MPPFVLVLPPLIGLLPSAAMTFDALAEHASKAERQAILHMHRYRLMLMGVVCGYIGAAPSLVCVGFRGGVCRSLLGIDSVGGVDVCAAAGFCITVVCALHADSFVRFASSARACPRMKHL